MNTQTLPRLNDLLRGSLILSLVLSAACSKSATGPDLSQTPVDTTILALPPTGVTRDDLEPSGNVTETSDGYEVNGQLAMATSDTTSVVFHDADVRVHFDQAGHVTGLEGTVEIPSPNKRVSFENPVRARVGIFKGSYLNQKGDLAILLDDDTDYFVYDVGVALQMNIATGQTGSDAVKPVVVRAPLGGRITMVVDYTDPMYYLFGSQDLIGSAGVAWSLHHRLPFRPWNPVENLGAFDGGSERVGSMTIFKILSIDGQLVDNEYSEVHLLAQDPLSSSLRAGYQAGFNGNLGLDLFVKDVAGIELPVASASGGVWSDLSTGAGFQGHVYARGRTTNDFSWWPTFIPARPVAALDVRTFLRSDGDFEVGLEGEYGWDFPDGRESMSGSFTLRPDSMTLEGTLQAGDASLSVGGIVRKDATTLYVQPPQQLLDSISKRVNDEVMPRITDAQKAWEDFEKATQNYEFELSLRGLRSALPTMVDRAKAEMQSRLASVVAGQKGKVWYKALRNEVNAKAAPYYRQLDALKAAAENMQDDQQTRDAIESALRGVAAKKTFSMTFRYSVPVLGTLYSRTISFRVLTDDQVAKLIYAANNVKHIKETSDIRISMKQIYDQVDDKALFEQVRDDVQNGVLKIRAIDELGVVCRHGSPSTFDLYVTIDGRRHQAGSIPALTLASLLQRLPDIMIDALKTD